jgi:iron(III) transport system substrate-binding protein
MNQFRRFVPILTAFALLTALCLFTCAGCRSAANREVVVYTSVDQVFSEPILRAFEQATGIRIRAVYDTEETKSTGVLNRLITEAQNPQADVFWSGDPVRPFQLIQRGLVEPYLSPQAASLPMSARAADGTWTGFAARARVILINKSRVAAEGMPKGVRDFADARWRGQTAIANPLFGTTTIHVGALFSVWGEQRTRAFLDELKQNEVRVASSNGEVKRLVVTAEVAFGLADTDDANEALDEGANIAVVYPDQDALGTLVMPTTVVLLRHAPHAAAARTLIDHLLSPAVEGQLAKRAGHMPLREGIAVSPNLRSATSLRIMQVDYGHVAQQLEAQQGWLRKWVGL